MVGRCVVLVSFLVVVDLAFQVADHALESLVLRSQARQAQGHQGLGHHGLGRQGPVHETLAEEVLC